MSKPYLMARADRMITVLCIAQVHRPDSCASAKVSVSTEDEQTVYCMSEAL